MLPLFARCRRRADALARPRALQLALFEPRYPTLQSPEQARVGLRSRRECGIAKQGRVEGARVEGAQELSLRWLQLEHGMQQSLGPLLRDVEVHRLVASRQGHDLGAPVHEPHTRPGVRRVLLGRRRRVGSAADDEHSADDREVEAGKLREFGDFKEVTSETASRQGDALAGGKLVQCERQG